MIDKAKQHNEDINNKLEDPKVKKDLGSLLQKAREKEIEADKAEAELQNFMKIVFDTLIVLFIGYIGYVNYEESRKTSFNNLETINKYRL